MVNFTGITDKVPLVEMFDFTMNEVTEILRYIGIVNEKSECREERLETYIFLHGDEQEIYNCEERKFIEKVGNIYIYNEFHKKIQHGLMPCRVIAAEIEANEPLKNCIFFMKEINKAFKGFIIFFIKVNHEFYVGMRQFARDTRDDCIISHPIVTYGDMEEMCDRLLYNTDCEDFISYYEEMAMAIECKSEKFEDYDEQIVRKKGIQYSYLQMLSEIEKLYGLSAIGEKNRYYKSFEEIEEKNFFKALQEAYSDLSFIESLKANTMEMLFEAEEIVQLATKVEEEQNLFMATYQEKNIYSENEIELSPLLNNPEMIIKMIRQKKGI